MAEKTFQSTLFWTDNRSEAQAKDELNEIFSSCSPNKDDECDRGALIDALVDMYQVQSNDERNAERLREMFGSVLKANAWGFIRRDNFLRTLLNSEVAKKKPAPRQDATPSMFDTFTQIIMRLEAENLQLSQQCALEKEKASVLKERVSRLTDVFLKEATRAEELEDKLTQQDHEVRHLKLLLGASKKKNRELDAQCKLAEKASEAAISRGTALEIELEAKKNECEVVIKESGSLLGRISYLSSVIADLRCQKGAIIDANYSHVMAVPDDDQNPSPDRSASMYASPIGTDSLEVSIAEELNQMTSLSEPLHQKKQTQDAYTDVEGLVKTVDVGTSVSGIIMTESLDTTVKPMEVDGHASGIKAATQNRGSQTSKLSQHDFESQTVPPPSTKSTESQTVWSGHGGGLKIRRCLFPDSSIPAIFGRLGSSLKWIIILLTILYFTWYLSQKGYVASFHELGTLLGLPFHPHM